MTEPFIKPIDTGVTLPEGAVISGKGCPRCGVRERDTVLIMLKARASPISSTHVTCAECLTDIVVGAQVTGLAEVYLERQGEDGKVRMQLIEAEV